MKIKKFVNSILKSNTYILFSDEENFVYIIDPGDSYNIFDWLIKNSKVIKGIFVTHSHFDHIYGINDIIGVFPDIIIHSSAYTKIGMMSEILNGSRYHDTPYIVNKNDIQVIKEGDVIQLWKNTFLSVYETPGHDRDCLTFLIDNNLFTGDSLIPGSRVYVRSKYSDKILASNSIDRILKQFDDYVTIWPGHLDKILINEIKSNINSCIL